jgi:1-acyl-sn-glycerol-3-phosphate acyltransferase
MGRPRKRSKSEKPLRMLERYLYYPWQAAVFYPTLGSLTVSLGLLSIALSQVNKRAAFHCGTVWAWALCRTNFTKVVVEGREHADPNTSFVIMSNHQSLFDTLAIYGHLFRQFRWVMKKELRQVPVLGWACDEIGHIYIDRSNREAAIASLREAQEKLEPGVSVLFFPEGHRSDDGQLGEFKKGGFKMALQMGLPILPITVSGAADVLPAQSLMLLPGTIRITIHEPVETSSCSEENIQELMGDVRDRIASAL